MDEETHKLLQLARENPFHLFEVGELAKIHNATKLITAISMHPETCFNGKKSRPEWVMDWLRSHPGFGAK